ncbi:uncharacterized protein LOC142326882 [Lycorma delicatula]|uniref:uncharacterized protein LOC142326882 n=1 Tax=Lycorma delicatula TaxID=130591 RepID=UPI003F50E1AA
MRSSMFEIINSYKNEVKLENPVFLNNKIRNNPYVELVLRPKFFYPSDSGEGGMYLFIDGRFICDTCKKSYKHKHHLQRHIKYECGKPPQFQYYVEYDANDNGLDIITSISDNSSGNLVASFYENILVKSKGKKYRCRQCMRRYSHQSSLIKHIRWECGLLPKFQCSYCDYKFLLCMQCGRQYKHQSSLSKHLKYECGVLPQFQCPYCDHRCKQKGHMKTHIALRHRSIVDRLQ